MLHGLRAALKRKARKIYISPSLFPLFQGSYCFHLLPAFGGSSVPQAAVFYTLSRIYNWQRQEDYSGVCYSPITKRQKHTFSINYVININHLFISVTFLA